MRSSISSFNLFQNTCQRLTGSTRYFGVGALVFVLLISNALIAHGQTIKDAPITDSATVLRQAKLIFVRKKTVFIEAPELENELRKRPEFQRWGLAITRNEADADLIIEVGRKVFTRFVYTVIDPRTNIVVMSGKLSSLGGTLSTKIAKRFIEQMQRVRQ